MVSPVSGDENTRAPLPPGLITEPGDKQALLAALRDSLRVWEEQIDLAGLDPQKQAALAELAVQTIDTLKHMIAGLQAEMDRLKPEQD
jgi:hypothetical protein